MREFRGRPGSGLGDGDAERIGGFLDERFGEEAPVTAAEMVAAARPARSPIHRDFEWRDGIAAEKYREQQARLLLRSVFVVVHSGIGEVETRAYHQVTIVEADEERRRVYMPASVVWREPDLAAQPIEKALAELQGWTRRWRQYEQLAGVAGSIDEIVEEVTRTLRS